MRRPLILLAAAAALVPALTTLAPAQDREGRVGPGLTTNGRQLDPAGRMTELGNFPTGGALSPDGRFYWTVSAGHGINDVRIMDVASGQVRQTLATSQPMARPSRPKPRRPRSS